MYICIYAYIHIQIYIYKYTYIYFYTDMYKCQKTCQTYASDK